MQLIDFLKWQWNRFNQEEKVLVFIAICVIGWLVISIKLGFDLVAITVGSVAIFFSMIFLSIVIKLITIQWKRYIADKDKEADAIIGRLRGQQK